MIVNNFDVHWTRRLAGPLETNPPLIIDTDAVLTLAISQQRFKTIAGQGRKVSQRRGRLQTVELQTRGVFKARE